MKKMNYILRNAGLAVLAAGLVLSCAKTADEGANVANKRYLDAWRAINYPSAVERNGVYVIEDKPGTGLEWNESLSVNFINYPIRNLDGTVQYNSDEDWAKQLGTWDQTYYFGPQVSVTGQNLSYAGLDAILDGMREGGTRTAIIPSWLMTYDRYDTIDEYLEHETSNSAAIYTITFLGQTENLIEYELNAMR